MKIKFLLIICLCFFSIQSFSQESIVEDLDNNLLQKYIALARQNFPRKKGFDARVEKAKYAVTASSLSWFDMINGGYYYRPEKNNGSGIGGAVTNNGQLITQGFMVGISTSLGNLLAKPSIVKGVKADYKAVVAESQEYDITLANEVKSRYYDFLASKKQLAIRNIAAQSLKGLLNDAQLKYEKGEIAIDVYTASKNAATEADAMVLTAEVIFLKSKNMLEDIIGVKLETVK